MKKVFGLIFFLCSMILVGCSSESSFSREFKDAAASEGIYLDSYAAQIWFDKDGVKFGGLTMNTPDDDAEEITTILPLETEKYYDYDIAKEDGDLILSVVTDSDPVTYTLEIQGPRLLFDNTNDLTYKSSYALE